MLFKLQLFQDAVSNSLSPQQSPVSLNSCGTYSLYHLPASAGFIFFLCFAFPEKMESSLKAGKESYTCSVFSLYIAYIVLNNIFHKYEYHLMWL